MLYVFDLDATLYLERGFVKSEFQAVSGWVYDNFGLDGFSEQVWRLFEDGKHGNIFDLALSDFCSEKDGLL